MKIYYLSSSAFSDNQLNTLKYLSKDHEIIYAVIIPYNNSNFTKQELDDYCLKNNIHFISFEPNHRFRNPKLMFSYWRILQSIKKEKPDLVYFANFDQLYLNTLLLALDPSKTIIAMHDVESHSGTAFNYLSGLSKRMLMSRFQYFHTFSGIQQRILQAKVPGKTVYNVPLPLLDFGPPPQPTDDSERVEFLFFGNILTYKGLDLLLPAFKRVAVRNPNVQLTIAGRCQEWEEKYAKLVEDCSQIVAHIRFIDNSEIPGFFSAATYLVLPYRDTTQSGPLMIAYNYNVPVLVSDAEGFNEFTEEGVTGYRFKLQKTSDIERVLESCAKAAEPERNALKKRLAAYTKANLSTERLVEKYNQMFTDVSADQ